MDDLEYNIQRHTNHSKITTVRVPKDVREWMLANNTQLASLVRCAPQWRSDALKLKEENLELSGNLAAAMKKLAILHAEIYDLQKWKENAVKRLKNRELTVVS